MEYKPEEKEPLNTAVERVNRAFEKLTAGKSFTEEQKKWLDRIREHLNTHLSIEINDFQVVPIFRDNGGWNVANHIFGHQLIQLLNELKEAIAS